MRVALEPKLQDYIELGAAPEQHDILGMGLPSGIVIELLMSAVVREVGVAKAEGAAADGEGCPLQMQVAMTRHQ